MRSRPRGVPPRVRERVYARDGGCCRRCGSTYHLTPSHRLARGRGGLDVEGNLDTLCFRCHRWCEDNPNLAEADGWRVPGFVVRGEYRGPEEFRAEVEAWLLG